jgi:beta-lactamase regulating signal transducer with metallopeptidase domain
MIVAHVFGLTFLVGIALFAAIQTVMYYYSQSLVSSSAESATSNYWFWALVGVNVLAVVYLIWTIGVFHVLNYSRIGWELKQKETKSSSYFDKDRTWYDENGNKIGMWKGMKKVPVSDEYLKIMGKPVHADDGRLIGNIRSMQR